MKHLLPSLEFATDAFVPFLSAESFAFHHGKHHRAYVDKLNALIQGSDMEQLSLTELVKRAEGAVFNNAAQHFNHSFFWRCITPGRGSEPTGELLDAIERDFGSLAKLKEEFTSAAKSHFGSGWCWIEKNAEGGLRVRTTENADNPLTTDAHPILTCDVWEHAYYIDHRNDRAKYVSAFWEAVNWDFAALAFSEPAKVESVILRQ